MLLPVAVSANCLLTTVAHLFQPVPQGWVEARGQGPPLFRLLMITRICPANLPAGPILGCCGPCSWKEELQADAISPSLAWVTQVGGAAPACLRPAAPADVPAAGGAWRSAMATALGRQAALFSKLCYSPRPQVPARAAPGPVRASPIGPATRPGPLFSNPTRRPARARSAPSCGGSHWTLPTPACPCSHPPCSPKCTRGSCGTSWCRPPRTRASRPA